VIAVQGFLLGLANGATCLAYCAPVLVPFLLGEGQRVRQNWAVLGKFLGGRLGGYLLFGLLAWAINQLLLEDSSARAPVLGVAYVVLAVLLIVYGVVKTPTACAGNLKGARAWLNRWPAWLPVGLGFLTGLNVCPPFLMAFAGAAGTGTLWQSLFFFGAFFLGTSLYFLPFPFLGAFRRFQAVRIVGKFAAVIVALYYLFAGAVLLAAG
jgi:sulfite exporter TauE/SafE